MSSCALTELHIVPEKTTVTAQYYVSEILQKSLLPAMRRSHATGFTLEKKFMLEMSEAIFMQDGAPSHNAIMTKRWFNRMSTPFG